MMNSALLALVCLLIVESASARDAGPIFASEGRKVVAAVLFSSSTNSVGQRRRVGGFVRVEGDTVWNVVPNENTLAFASGYSMQHGRARYYICGGNGLFRTEDRGASWRMLTDWKTMEVLDVAIDPGDDRIIYIATPFGIFRSTDDGATWNESMRGMKKWFVQDIVIDRTKPNVLYATAEDDLYISNDRGARWNSLGVGVSELRAFFQDPSQQSVLCVGTEDEGIRVSGTSGGRWRTAEGTKGMTILAIAGSA
ncbi:MAG TPA: hypothetical protein VK470_03855, partial [Bacteroidota bacterium]|nr:hypothetical protein [Bacteroidota bacterium]